VFLYVTLLATLRRDDPFTSTDGQAVLPGNYTFLRRDGGTHSFSVTLKTAGAGHSVTATDTGNSITGSQTGISVNE
jgi:hypothetical protein